jgi:UDP-N-acetylglucosamine 2-epimerase
MLTVLNVIGTRPEAIKMAPVIEELRRHPDRVRSLVCVTGQHRELLDQALDLFQIRPDFDLNLMQTNQSLTQLTTALFPALDGVIEACRPDWVLAQGDTTTVLVASLVAYYRRVPLGHVEAGLRSGDRDRPFPEEINRCVADLVAELLFAPTERCRETLLQQQYPASRIIVTGNTVIDALLDVARRPYDWSAGPLNVLPRDRKYVLITAHRRESFGRPIREICSAIADLARIFENDKYHFVYPVHLNPHVRRPVQEILAGKPNLSLIEPLDYLALVNLMKRSSLILTDSGGIQEEAPGLKVPVLVLRETTERPEGIETGVVRLVGTERGRIVEEAARLLRDPEALATMASGANPYGDGRAAGRIVSALLDWDVERGDRQ